MAVRGDAPQTIQWRAGHTTFAMTERYIEAARKVADGLGRQLPALPSSLLDWSAGTVYACMLCLRECA
jgi:hypothetical protein